ncbi:type Z 30S ribosomal protein S14 [Candidatus Nomurabacteria bacterium]|uniref:Small ribosomal subunit protein uS14 n=1 Tax=Candidatus Dojkabacteria bacterium TaxID=2099670 RepID=A0A955I903_9BACT|nr:type Z 30S ribosomal protein S14 [Candidatus Dojkabacteria bacterium]MCB9789409.1 type Z 30S ribosomal protein S14 [Candidatus Nomurabacteria bacterium]MCB9803731.1 type Z 30S ribosomal protein S14 [Candidatus Nomurabacteria bacterium]
MAKKSKVVQQRRYQLKQKHSTKAYNRCMVCGRSRGYIREFGLCRICFRQMAHEGQIPGVKKAIW